MMYQKILVAVDGSKPSKRALREAVRLAKVANADVRVVRVVRNWPLSTAGGYDRAAMLWDVRPQRDAALDDARKVMETEGVAGEVDTVGYDNVIDDVARCLQRYAERFGADLVVMGTHGRRGARRLALGSVAESFARLSRQPILIVRGRV
jgi:nucleotide-binding universal stress UspA family protein